MTRAHAQASSRVIPQIARIVSFPARIRDSNSS